MTKGKSEIFTMTSPVIICASIVTYRSDMAKLREAVSSFLRCTLPVHLMIIDNDSGDDYVQQLHSIAGAQLMEAGTNKGFGFGHNIALKRAPASSYTLILNPDVIIHDGTLERMVAYLENHADVGLLAPKVQNPDGTLQALNKRLPSVFDLFVRRFIPAKLQQKSPWIMRKAAYYEMRDVGYAHVVDVPFVSGCFMLFRTELLHKLGGFDERYFMYLEDCDITRRLNVHARAVYLPAAIITHHWARGSHKSLRLMLVMLRSMWVYFNIWGWKWI